MKKLITMTALLLTAGSAFAGDFEAAQNAGFDSTKGPATVIALVLTSIGAGVWWLWKNHKRTKLPLAISTIVIATMLSLHADDGYNWTAAGSNMFSRFGSWFGSFWTSHFEWGNMAPFNGGANFTPVPSVPPKDDGRAGSGNGATPPRQQN